MRDPRASSAGSTLGAGRPGSVGGPSARRALILLLAVPMLFLDACSLCAPAQAAITHKLTGTFDGSGTLSNPGPVAVDKATGSVYVLTDRNTIRKFDAAGNPANFSFTGASSIEICSGCIYQVQISQIAVDNSGGVNQGVIYASSEQQGVADTTGVFVYLPTGQLAVRFEKSHIADENFGVTNDGPFCGSAVDANGNLYIQHAGAEALNGGYTDKFHPGLWMPNANPPQLWPVAGSFFQPDDRGTCRVVADDFHYLYTSKTQFTPFGTPATVKRWPMTTINQITPPSKVVDTGSTSFDTDQSNGDLYSDEMTTVTRFDSTGAPVETFGSGDLTDSIGIAVNAATGTVYTSDRGSSNVRIYSAVTTPDIINVLTASTQTTATVSARIGRAGAGDVTGCSVEYGPTSGYGSSAPCSGSLPYTSDTEITATLPGLTTETPYHFSIAATNANGTTHTIDRTVVPHAVADVETEVPSAITQTAATLNGSFTGNGDPATVYRFQWGTDTSYGSTTPDVAIGAVSGPTHVAAPLDSLDVYLASSPPYHYRLVVSNSAGTTYGPDMSFRTLPPFLPAISSTSSSDVAPTSVTLGAQVNPGMGDTVFLFEFGTSTAYGDLTPPSASIGNDTTDHPVSTGLTDLEPATTYHFRAVATNFSGTSFGPDQTFTTPAAPRVEGTVATAISESRATLTAGIRPGFRPTTYQFEYGLGTGYGSTTPQGVLSGADNEAQAVSSAISGLTPGTTYHFRVVATNAIATTSGPDQTLITQQASPPPVESSVTCGKGFLKKKGKCVSKKRKRHNRHRHVHRDHG
jgi:hypothetical protein